MIILLVYVRPARTFWNSTHVLSTQPFRADWSRKLLHNPMWNMAANSILYSIYPLSTRNRERLHHQNDTFLFCSVYVVSSQWSAVSSTVYVHILVAETGFERGVGWGKFKKKRGVCIYIKSLHTQGGTYIDKVCKNLCKVREQYMYHKWYVMSQIRY